jgi:hypothetical protein
MSATATEVTSTAAVAPSSSVSATATTVPQAVARDAEHGGRNQRHAYRNQSFTHNTIPLFGCNPSAPRPTCSPYPNSSEINRSGRILTAFSRICRVTDLRLVMQIARIAQALLFDRPACKILTAKVTGRKKVSWPIQKASAPRITRAFNSL